MPSPTVLYIDDFPQLLQVPKATLESHGYSIETASNAHTALKVLEATPVTAVLVEYKQVRYRRGSRGLPYQAAISQPAHHPGFSLLGDAREDPVVGG
jgi:CheY-like chemotaxis protein